MIVYKLINDRGLKRDDEGIPKTQECLILLSVIYIIFLQLCLEYERMFLESGTGGNKFTVSQTRMARLGILLILAMIIGTVSTHSSIAGSQVVSILSVHLIANVLPLCFIIGQPSMFVKFKGLFLASTNPVIVISE